MKVVSSCWILLVFVVTFIKTDPPTILNVDFHVKEYQTLTTGRQVAILTATFDQDIYANASCNEGNKTIYQRCCTSQMQSDCYTPVNPDHVCIDSTTNITRENLATDQTKTYEFRVENYETCDSVAFLARTWAGDPDIFVSIKYENQNPYVDGSNYKSETVGSEAFLKCCSTILNDNPAWNGTVYVTVASFTDTSYDVVLFGMSFVTDVERILTLLDDPSLLSLTDFYWLSPLQITCPNSNQSFSTTDCDTGFCMFFTPSNDPLFTYLATITLLKTEIDINPKQLSIGLVTKLVTLKSENRSVTTFPFPGELLSDPSCLVSFPYVINRQGQSVANTAPFTKRPLTCSKQSFEVSTRGISDVVASLKQSNTELLSDVDDYLFRAVAYTISNAWLGCVEMVQTSLSTSSVSMQFINQTRSCYATNSTSAEYLTDPCCNPALQDTLCCVPRDVQAPVTSYAISSDNIKAQCNFPSCTEQSAQDYIVLAETTGDLFSGCSKESFDALADPIFTEDPWGQCASTIFQTLCESHTGCQNVLGIQDSLCLGVGYCTIPCLVDSDCETGSCLTVQNSRTCLLYDQYSSHNRSDSSSIFVGCLETNMNPFVTAYIKQDLKISLTAPQTEYRAQFYDALIDDTCVGIGTISYEQASNETECLSTHSCNWALCNDFDSPATCTQENCLDNTMSEQFCQVCYGSKCYEVSIPATCVYIDADEEEACASVGGLYNPLRPFQEKCKANSTAHSYCFPAQYCTANEQLAEVCDPKCYVPSITTQTDCTNANITGLQLTWQQWTLDSVTYGLCSDDTIGNYMLCMAAGAGKTSWWPGSALLADSLMTKDSCETVGFCAPSYNFVGQDTCLSSFYCDGCSTCDQYNCTTTGICGNQVGCHLPFRTSGDCFGGERWTPEGCYADEMNQTDCAREGGQWIDTQLRSEEVCRSAGSVCIEGTYTASFDYSRPSGVTFKNESECTKCNARYESVYTYRPSRWVPSQFLPFSWATRNFTTANVWTPALNQTMFKSMFRRATARKYSNIITTNIYCRYSKLISSLDLLACDCGLDKGSDQCFSSITESVISVVQACNNVPATYDVQLGYLTVEPTFTSGTSDCMDITVAQVPQYQFLQRRLATLSSVTVSLSQAGKSSQVRFIKNEDGVAVGEVLGDGLSIDPPGDFTAGTLKVCVQLPVDEKSDMDLTVLDLAVPNEDWTSFTALGLNLKFGDQYACANVSSKGLVVFPVGLITDWENASFIQTLQPGEIFVIYFGAFLYLLGMALTIWHIYHHAQEHRRTHTKAFCRVGRLALIVLGLMLLDRFLYLMLLPNGILEQSRVADVLFSELPAMFYLCIYSLIVLRWAEICHFTMTSGHDKSFNRLKPVVIAVNAFIAAAFIVLLAVFLAQPSGANDVLSCASNFVVEQTGAEIVTIIYHIVFSAFCLTFSILFIVYGTKIIRMMRESNQLAMELDAEDKNRRTARYRKLLKLIIISSVCTICLLAQSASLIWISFEQATARSVIGVLIFIYIVELGPAVIFILLFKATSIFVNFSRNKGWKKTTMDTDAKTTTHLKSAGSY